MVRIRLRRTGKKGQPSYRVVVADREAPRDGRFIEIIGHYNPRTEPMTVSIKDDRALYWLSQGAQPSDAVARLLRKQGILARFEVIKSGAPDPGPAAASGTDAVEELEAVASEADAPEAETAEDAGEELAEELGEEAAEEQGEEATPEDESAAEDA